jgi:hypothetical protein
VFDGGVAGRDSSSVLDRMGAEEKLLRKRKCSTRAVVAHLRSNWKMAGRRRRSMERMSATVLGKLKNS